MKKYSLIIIAGFLLAGCGSKKSVDKQKETDNKAVLSQNDLFNKEIVNNFLSKVDKNLQQGAKKEFLTGVDQYRNRKQIDSAITTFKNSITIYPFAKTYYELGNAYMDKKDFKTAVDAYTMAEALEFDPLSLVFYNISCAYSGMEKADESLKYLQLSIENGYTNLSYIMSDSGLVFVRKDPGFDETVKTAMAGNTSSDQVMFTMYTSHFPALNLPYNLDEATSQKFDYKNAVSYDYVDFVPGMVNSQFSREVDFEYFYVGKITETDKYIALLYSKGSMMNENPPVSVLLATYNTGNGKIIDFENVAGLEYYSDSLRTSTINKDLSVEVKYFEIIWEKNPDDYGYDSENKRKGLNQLAIKNFKVDVNGNIVETQKLLGSLYR